MFEEDMTVDQLYGEDAPYMADLMDSLATTEIEKVQLLVRHSQLKLLITMVDGNTAISKPMRFVVVLFIDGGDSENYTERQNKLITSSERRSLKFTSSN